MTGDNHDFGKFDNFGKFGKFGNFAKFNTLFDCRLVISEINLINALEDWATVVPPPAGGPGGCGALLLYLTRPAVLSYLVRPAAISFSR